MASRIRVVATEKTADSADELVAEFGDNASYVADLLSRYRGDPNAVDEEWRRFFQERLGEPPPAVAPVSTRPDVASRTPPARERAGEAVPLRGGSLRIAENMEASLQVPTATSQRQIPIKLADENRRIVNDARAADDLSKISFTQLIAWGIVQALKSYPRLNDAYDVGDEGPIRVKRDEIRFGLAVDV
jgi:2-oxoglutarate dehydrogenase E1 component